MKKGFLFLLLLFPFLSFSQDREIGNLVIKNVPDLTKQDLGKLDQYQYIRSTGFCNWDLTGEGLFIRTRFGETMQIHHVSKPGAYREQITFFNEPMTAVITCPGKGFLFYKDVGGNENYQIYFFDVKTKATKLLTDGISKNVSGDPRGGDAAGVVWNTNRSEVMYTSNKRNGQDLDLYSSNLQGIESEKKIIELKGGGWQVNDWSEDGKWALLINEISATESTLHLLNVESGKLEQLNPVKEVITYSAALFSKDGKGIFFTSDQGNEFSVLSYMDLTSKKITPITKNIPWGVSKITTSDNGNSIVFTTNEHGYEKIYLLDTKSMKYELLKNIPDGVLTSPIYFNQDGTKIAFSLSGRLPSDVYTYDIKNSQIERWTFGETGGLDPANFVPAQVIEYPTFDKVKGKSRMIPAIIFSAPNSSPASKSPVVIYMHGGPESQWDVQFIPFVQYLASELGITMILPNIRGSLGYGKTFANLDNAYLRENSIKDIGALLDWIEKQPNLDSKRVAVYGGSYGGYMTLACMTRYNERLKCGVDVVGMSNLVTFLENTSPYRQDLRRVEYGDERIPAMREFLTKNAPINHIQKVTKPMFIIQGKNDPRVPITESDQMVDVLEKKGNLVWYLVAKDEGHGFAKKVNRDFEKAATALFFKEYLLK